jgi:hypothetical protein
MLKPRFIAISTIAIAAILVLFSTDITSAFITNLENGLTQLNNSIRSKASPLDIMMIVYTQIQPNLLVLLS